MIVPREPQLRRMVAYVGLPVLLMALYDLVVVFGFKVMHWTWLGSPHVPLGLYGSAIGVIVGFRNNSAYGRWWEGRTLWGAVVNNSRSFARQVVSAIRANNPDEVPEVEALQVSLTHHQIAYVHALRQHLRQLPPWEELARILPKDEIEYLKTRNNVPLELQLRMGRMLLEAKDKGWTSHLAWQAMDRNLDDLADAQGGLERIKNTPLPKQYDYFPQLFVQLYCLVLPMGMVQQLGWFTPLGSTLVGFMFLALDKIGRDLEDPFDNSIFDVPMTAICKTIEINLRQLLGETDVPAPEKPIHGVLW
ncbi:bestrophin family protein [Granulicella cerasi]|uniref:Bestrophin family protein n=1 Tax=Granulicella cerasi TaxID=741063 RepID=A0ABW1ZB15_9BACT|nr:bestrophin family ion channel [Granulicella cerasi]